MNFSRSEFNKYSSNHTGTTFIFVQGIFEELFLGLFDFTVNHIYNKMLARDWFLRAPVCCVIVAWSRGYPVTDRIYSRCFDYK